MTTLRPLQLQLKTWVMIYIYIYIYIMSRCSMAWKAELQDRYEFSLCSKDNGGYGVAIGFFYKDLKHVFTLNENGMLKRENMTDDMLCQS